MCVLGLGYIGLPTAALFATHGHAVLGVDIDETIVNRINRGQIHIEEPGLNLMVKAAVNSGNLLARTHPEPADVFIIAVPTPITPDKRADLAFVIAAAEAIVPYLRQGNLVILESTSPPRTTADLLAPILERSGLKAGGDFDLAHCPERVLPGKILHELVFNNRIVGGINEPSAQAARALYQPIVQGEIIVTDSTSAEMAKLMENTYRDVNIALANELSIIATDIDCDALEVIKIANMHPRVHLHQPGPGVGGHCLAVDPWFIVEKSPNAKLIQLSRKINDQMPYVIAKRIQGIVREISDPAVTLLGVSYKGNVDDIRETPALPIIEQLQTGGVAVRIYDPHVRHFPFELMNLENALLQSDLIVILSDHNEFKYLCPVEISRLMRHCNVFDTKNCINAAKWEEEYFTVTMLGRSSRKAAVCQ